MSSQLRILFICGPAPIGSGESIATYIGCIGSSLVTRGHEVHVLSCYSGEEARDYTWQGLQVHARGQTRAHIRGLRRLNGLARAPRTVWRLERGAEAFAEYRRLGLAFDVVEFPDWGARGWRFALHRGPARVAHLHSAPPVIPGYCEPMDRDLAWASRLVDFSVRRAHAVTAPSRLLVDAMRRLGYLRGCEVEVIRHPIDWARWRQARPVEETDPIVLFAGRVVGVKGPDVLVRAMHSVRRVVPEARAIFAGPTYEEREGISYLDWLRQTTDLSGCEFIGYVPREDLVMVFSSSRVVAVPSWFDPYALVALEALAAGRPLVVTSTTGACELVEEHGGGTIVPPGDPRALAEALLPFLLDPHHAAAVGRLGQRAVRQEADPGISAARREALYLKALEARGRRWIA